MGGRIVVGVDGSEESIAALRWARDEASLRRAELVVVHGWTYPHVVDLAGMAAYGVAYDDLEAEARQVIDASIAAAAIPEDTRVERVVVHSDATSALLDEAKGADLLVVGSRGRGGFAGLLLGSVSQQCTHHAPCPVVVIRRPADSPR